MKMYAVYSKSPRFGLLPVVFKRNTFGSKFSYEKGFTVFDEEKKAERAKNSFIRRAERRNRLEKAVIKTVEVDPEKLW